MNSFNLKRRILRHRQKLAVKANALLVIVGAIDFIDRR